MKILHLTTHLEIGGISRYLVLLAGAQARHGHDVAVLSSGGSTALELRAQGVRILPVSFRTKNILSPKLWWAIPEVARWVRRERFQVLHAHTRVMQMLASVVSRLTGVPAVSTAHGFYRMNLGRRLWPCWGERAIGISRGVTEHLQDEHGLDASRVRLARNAIDVEGWTARVRAHDPAAVKRELGLPADAWVVGSVARLVADKGHEYLIRALKQVRASDPRAVAVIVGEGRERVRLERLARELSLERAVIFAGAVADTARLVAAFDVFVLPATWREGFGLAVVESMAVEKPVIVTNIWALTKLVDDNVTGFLVPPKRADLLAQRILEIITSPERAARVARAGAELVRTYFTLERLEAEVEGVYQEVVPQDAEPSAARAAVGAK